MRRSEVFGAIDIERGNQDRKFPGHWERFTRAGKRLDVGTARDAAFEMLAILVEEVGEVAHAIIERDDDNLTVELVQVAAVVTAWLEGRTT